MYIASDIFGSGDTGGKTALKHILVTATAATPSILEVSGITYDGQPVNDAVFKVLVYIWGRTGTDVAPSIADIKPENRLLPSQKQAAPVRADPLPDKWGPWDADTRLYRRV